MRLNDTYVALRSALAPLGIEVGHEVLDVWQDRERHGYPPLPVDALKRLADLTKGLLSQVPP